MNLPKPSSSPAQPAATKFDEYFLGEGLMTDARNAVTKAIAQTQAKGLPLNGSEPTTLSESGVHIPPTQARTEN